MAPCVGPEEPVERQQQEQPPVRARTPRSRACRACPRRCVTASRPASRRGASTRGSRRRTGPRPSTAQSLISSYWRLRPPHHREEVRLLDGRVRVLRRVAVGVVHAVHDRVRPRVQVARAVDEPGEEVEEALPPLAHRELAVRAVAVVEEALEEDRELPVQDEEQEDGHALLARAARPSPTATFASCARRRIVTVPSARHVPRLDGCVTRARSRSSQRRQRRVASARPPASGTTASSVGTNPRARLCSPPAPGSNTSSPRSMRVPDALVVADDEVQVRHLHRRAPVAAVEALALRPR